MEVIARQESFRADLLRRRHLKEALDEFIGIEVAVAGEDRKSVV